MPQGARYHLSNTHGAARQAFHRPQTLLGSAGHWIREAGLLLPLIIGEWVPDPDQKFRYMKFASLAAALISQGMWTARIHAERKASHADGHARHAPA